MRLFVADFVFNARQDPEFSFYGNIMFMSVINNLFCKR